MVIVWKGCLYILKLDVVVEENGKGFPLALKLRAILFLFPGKLQPNCFFYPPEYRPNSAHWGSHGLTKVPFRQFLS